MAFLTQRPNGTNDESYCGEMDRVGKIGEDYIIKAIKKMKEKGEIKGAKDVRKVPEYRRLDVDFLIYKESEEIKVEVKTDTQSEHTGNIVCELFRVYKDKRGMVPSWGIRLQADVLYYVFLNSKEEPTKYYEITREEWIKTILDYISVDQRREVKKIKSDKEKDTYAWTIPYTNGRYFNGAKIHEVNEIEQASLWDEQ